MRALRATLGLAIVVGLGVVVIGHAVAGDWLRACGIVGGVVALWR